MYLGPSQKSSSSQKNYKWKALENNRHVSVTAVNALQESCAASDLPQKENLLGSDLKTDLGGR